MPYDSGNSPKSIGSLIAAFVDLGPNAYRLPGPLDAGAVDLSTSRSAAGIFGAARRGLVTDDSAGGIGFATRGVELFLAVGIGAFSALAAFGFAELFFGFIKLTGKRCK